ncbi:MAG: hypothetical protein ACLQM8_00005, partial [Limisphaerales bacterium]
MLVKKGSAAQIATGASACGVDPTRSISLKPRPFSLIGLGFIRVASSVLEEGGIMANAYKPNTGSTPDGGARAPTTKATLGLTGLTVNA